MSPRSATRPTAPTPTATTRHRLLGRVHGLGVDDRQVPRLRRRRQRRGDQQPADHDRQRLRGHDAADLDDQCNAATCGSSYYTAAVSVTLTATDSGGSGVSQIVYTTDGSDPSQSNGSVYAGAFTLSATTTVKYRAFDVAGNAEAVKSQLIQVDSVAPTSTISCNGNPCGSGWFNGAVSVTLAATDNSGGSGVSQIRYTTNGTTPTATTGNVYTGAFTVSTSPTTVKYRAFDPPATPKRPTASCLQIDTVAPSSTIHCNGTTCAASFYSAAVSVTLTASDVGGSGVSQIVYTTDGSDPSQSNGTVYSGAFTLSSTTTVKYRAYDNAGNAEPINSALIQVDTTPPSTTLNCAASPCSGSSWYPSGVSLSLTSTDSASGVAQIRYTTNGTVPTKTTGTIYTAPFAISATRRSTTAPTTTPATSRTTTR